MKTPMQIVNEISVVRGTDLERWNKAAAIIAARDRDVRAAERERCAHLADQWRTLGARNIAATIRALPAAALPPPVGEPGSGT